MMTQHSEMTRHTTATGGRRSAVLAVLTAHIALSVGLLGETAGGDGLLIGGSAWDVAALAVAVGLGVFKPGRRLGAPGDQAPGDQAPADQAPADQAPADQAPADQAPADQAPGEQAPGVRRP